MASILLIWPPGGGFRWKGERGGEVFNLREMANYGGYEEAHGSIALIGAEHAVELIATGTTGGATVRISQVSWGEQP